MFGSRWLLVLISVFVLPTAAQEAAAPLGLELGKVTCRDALSRLGKGASRGRSEWSGGEVLTLSRQVVPEIPDLERALVICDRAGAVIAVQLALPKGALRQTVDQLDRKYKSLQRDIPLVGNAYVSWKVTNAVIDLEACHLSFSMYLTYWAPGAGEIFNSHLASKRRAQDAKQASKL